MKTPKLLGFFARVWGWLGRLLRCPPGPQLPGRAVQEATVPPRPPVVARRVVMGENPLLAPARRRLKPSRVATTSLPKAEPAVEQTTKVPTPPEPILLPLELPTPKKEVSRALWMDDPRLVKPPSPKMSKIILLTKAEQQAIENAPTKQIQAPRQVAKDKASTLEQVELAIHSMPDAEEWEEPRNVVIHGSQTTLAPVLPADMAPKTLVQPRVQDSPELLDLIDEFNAKYGEFES